MRGVISLQVAQQPAAFAANALAATVTRPRSTCHVVLSKHYVDKTVENGEPSDEENDLLDLACVHVPKLLPHSYVPVQVRADRNVAAGMPGEADAKYARRAGSSSAVERAARALTHAFLRPFCSAKSIRPNSCLECHATCAKTFPPHSFPVQTARGYS